MLESSSQSNATIAALSLLALLVSGCALTDKLAPEPAAAPVAQPSQVSSASGVRGYLDTMDGLASSDPARQADVFYDVEREFTRAPTTASTLRYAVARVMPGHPNSSPSEGKRLLETLLATPERMTPEERTLAAVVLQETNARLKLEAENRRLLATLDGSNRSQANSDKRVQALLEENARLRRSLTEAQQKLEAIKQIERDIIERSPTPPGGRDANSSETQSSSTSR
jgi:hypothetical protein